MAFTTCFASAVTSDGGWGMASRDTVEEAQNAAMGNCRNANDYGCYLDYSVCADGSGRYSH